MNVSIRPLKEEDALTSVKWRNMPELWTYTKFRADKEILIDDELTWIHKVMNDPTGARFAIIVDDAYVGNIYLTDIKGGEAEYHIFIGDKNYWGKGVAQLASKLLLDYAKQTLGLNRVTLGVMPSNAGAVHLYKKLGFVETGVADGGFMSMDMDMKSWQLSDEI